MDGFAPVNAGVTSPAEFFSDENVGRIFAAAHAGTQARHHANSQLLVYTCGHPARSQLLDGDHHGDEGQDPVCSITLVTSPDQVDKIDSLVAIAVRPRQDPPRDGSNALLSSTSRRNPS